MDPEQAKQSDVRNLLAWARQMITEGKPSHALQAVVAAMKAEGGDAAVFQTLNRARELYRNKLQANAAAEELASLFAECAITEAQPINPVAVNPVPLQQDMGSNVGNPSVTMPDIRGTSILVETGRKQIVLDAFMDGSSFICLQCGGLVSNHRRDEHFAYWCSPI